MDSIKLEDYKAIMQAKKRADELGCIYDMGDVRRFPRIGPESRILFLDLDGCLLIDSQDLIYEEAGEIDPSIKPEIKAGYDKQISELITINEETKSQYIEMAKADNNSGRKLEKVETMGKK